MDYEAVYEEEDDDFRLSRLVKKQVLELLQAPRQAIDENATTGPQDMYRPTTEPNEPFVAGLDPVLITAWRSAFEAVTRDLQRSMRDIYVHEPLWTSLKTRRLTSSSVATFASPEVDELFRTLADEWTSETADVASPERRFMHPTYQRIIGLGSEALPSILRELRDSPDDWFWALAAISGEHPAAGATTFDDARSAWLKWGADARLI